MNIKKTISILSILFCILLMMASAACQDKEAAAREMLNEAMTLKIQGKMLDSKAILEKLVEDYPASEAATEANKVLLEQKRMSILFGKPPIETYRELIDTNLGLYLVDNGEFPSTEGGLMALVVNEDTSRHWKGPYINLANPQGIFKYFTYTRQNKYEYQLHRR